MNLRSILLTSALAISVFAAESSSFTKEDKQAALRGLDYNYGIISCNIERIKEVPVQALFELSESSDFCDYLRSLSSTELAEEARLTCEYSAKSLSAYESIREAVENGSISRATMGYLFSLERSRLWAKTASIKILKRTLTIFELNLALVEDAYEEAYSSACTEEIRFVIKQLDLAPIPVDTLNSLGYRHRQRAQVILTATLSANVEEVKRMLELLERDYLSVPKMASILKLAKLFRIKVEDHSVSCQQCQKFMEAELKIGNFTLEGRELLNAMITRIENRYAQISVGLRTIVDEELVSFLNQINFIDILFSPTPFIDTMREAYQTQFSNLTLKKAKFLKKQMLDIINAQLTLCRLIARSPDEVICNRFNAISVINVAKALKVDEGATLEQIFISA